MDVMENIRKTMGWCPLMSMKNIPFKYEPGYAFAPGIKGSGTLTNKSTVYEENAPYSNSIKVIITLGFAVLAFMYSSTVFGRYFGLQKVPEQAQFALLLAASIYALAMWSFFSMKFRITDNGVEAVMPPFKYSIPFSEIKDIRTIENTPWYAGWGVHLWGRKLLFVSMRKRAVEIEKKSGFFKRIVLTTHDPNGFIKKLKEEMV